MGDAKKAYNKSLSSCRHTIERAFSLLKNKWKILIKASTNDLEKINLLMCACCVLHNFCIVHSGSADVEDFEDRLSKHNNKSRCSKESPASTVTGISADDFVLTSEMAVKWNNIGLDGKTKESRILKCFERC